MNCAINFLFYLSPQRLTYIGTFVSFQSLFYLEQPTSIFDSIKGSVISVSPSSALIISFQFLYISPCFKKILVLLPIGIQICFSEVLISTQMAV